jgi:hypothetical protein
MAAVVGKADSRRLDYDTIESLFSGVADLLRSRGFVGGQHSQPTAHHLTGGRIYGDGFWLYPSIGCTVEIDRRSVHVDFYEWESPRDSGIFPTTDDQREAVRHLAEEIESYLRARLPDSYKIDVAIHESSG